MGSALVFALQVMELLPLITQGVVGAIEVFNQGRDVVQKMVDEGRDPTTEEWEALNLATKALRDKLHSDDA